MTPGVPILTKTRRRKPRQMKLSERTRLATRSKSTSKVIKLKREKVFQYIALYDCTRFRVLRLYRRLNQHSSLHFLGELRRALPFAIKKLQSDNGTEFPLASKLAVGPRAFATATSKPRRPQQKRQGSAQRMAKAA